MAEAAIDFFRADVQAVGKRNRLLRSDKTSGKDEVKIDYSGSHKESEDYCDSGIPTSFIFLGCHEISAQVF